MTQDTEEKPREERSPEEKKKERNLTQTDSEAKISSCCFPQRAFKLRQTRKTQCESVIRSEERLRVASTPAADPRQEVRTGMVVVDKAKDLQARLPRSDLTGNKLVPFKGPHIQLIVCCKPSKFSILYQPLKLLLLE
ncbi:hypothetical protein TURU_057992 [Turdus rufiventris]|nr:hypothetical protein TURU_057992 [Turdus rufiventris]